MRGKQNKTAASRGRSASRTKTERVKGRSTPQFQCKDSRRCGGGHERENYSVFSDPSMDNRSRLALQTGVRFPQQSVFPSQRPLRKHGHVKETTRSSNNKYPVCDNLAFPIQAEASRNLRGPLSMLGYQGAGNGASLDHCSSSFLEGQGPASQTERQHLFSRDCDKPIGTSIKDHDPFTFGGYKARGYDSNNASSPVTTNSFSKYVPSNRNLASIMAEYSKPRVTSETFKGSLFDTRDNSSSNLGSRNYLFNTPTNLTHDRRSFQTSWKPAEQFTDFDKSSAAFRPSTARPRSAGDYQTSSQHCVDYRDDMSTINFNSIRSDQPYNKVSVSQYGSHGSNYNYNRDNTETSLNSYNTLSIPRNPLSYDSRANWGFPQSNRRYDSAWDNSTNNVYKSKLFSNYTGNSASNAYDFSTPTFDTGTHSSRNSPITNTKSSLASETSGSTFPLTRTFSSGYTSHNFQSEKARLNRINNFIGKSTGYNPPHFALQTDLFG